MKSYTKFPIKCSASDIAVAAFTVPFCDLKSLANSYPLYRLCIINLLNAGFFLLTLCNWAIYLVAN
jgi:hypothetical protein